MTQPDGIKVGSTALLNSIITILDYRDPDMDDVVTFHKVGTTGWQDGSAVVQYTLDATTGEIKLAHDASGTGGTVTTVRVYAMDSSNVKSVEIDYVITVVAGNTAPILTPQIITISEGVAVNSTIATTLSSATVDPEVTTSCDASTAQTGEVSNRLCTAVGAGADGTNWRRVCLGLTPCSLSANEDFCTCRQQGLLFTLEKTSPLASELPDAQSALVDYPFELEEDGSLKIISKLDYETIPGSLSGLQAVYTLTIKVDDTGTATSYSGLNVNDYTPDSYTNPLATVSTLTITITNVQEKPFFDFTKKIINVPEDFKFCTKEQTSCVGNVIETKIYVTDPDKTEWVNGLVTFAMADHSADSNHFHPGGIDPDSLFDFIGGPPSNVQGAGTWDSNAEQHWTKLKLVSPLNFESMTEYTLEIVAKDTVHSLISEETDVVINVLDVNEVPSFTTTTKTMSVSEDAITGFSIGTVAATDVDADDTTLQFTITSGAIEGEFSVGGSGAGMTATLLVGETGLDFERKRAYTLVLTATDSGGLSATTNVVVNVVDVDDVEITDIRIGSTDSQLSTDGNEILTLIGKNFGLKDGTGTNVVVTYFRKGSTATPFTTTGCVVVEPNTMINCTTTADGYGTNLHAKVVISGTSSGTATSDDDATIDFQPPIITAVASVGPLPTSGSTTPNIVLTGTNFGPLSTAWRAEYGITTSAGYCTTDCLVTVAHTEIKCKSVAGVGSGHTIRLLLEQEGPGSTKYESLSSEGTVSYAPASVTSIVSINSLGTPVGKIRTKGGDSLRLTGTNFGPKSHTLAHCDGTAVTIGSNAVSAPLPLPPFVRYGPLSSPGKYEATLCQVTLDHTEIVCGQTPEGVGAGMRVRVDVGYLDHTVTGGATDAATVDYRAPTVSSVRGTGALNSNTEGGDVLEIEGTGFGPVGHATSVRVLYSQDPTTSLIYGRPPLPTFYANDCRVLSDTDISCTTGVGVGYNMTYSVEIEAQMSEVLNKGVRGSKAIARVPSHYGGAYARPTVSTVTRSNGDTIYNADTRGEEMVVVRGTNFGPIAAWNPITATFGMGFIHFFFPSSFLFF